MTDNGPPPGESETPGDSDGSAETGGGAPPAPTEEARRLPKWLVPGLIGLVTITAGLLTWRAGQLGWSCRGTRPAVAPLPLFTRARLPDVLANRPSRTGHAPGLAVRFSSTRSIRLALLRSTDRRVSSRHLVLEATWHLQTRPQGRGQH